MAAIRGHALQNGDVYAHTPIVRFKYFFSMENDYCFTVVYLDGFGNRKGLWYRTIHFLQKVNGRCLLEKNKRKIIKCFEIINEA